ncbi:MAG: hypothetical protein C0593_14125 [Marinilabiliales bacterium]|nr:MAG: hypothetical protein C0593_14125 [Marinilabiliales bacterium]
MKYHEMSLSGLMNQPGVKKAREEIKAVYISYLYKHKPMKKDHGLIKFPEVRTNIPVLPEICALHRKQGNAREFYKSLKECMPTVLQPKLGITFSYL